MREVFSARGTIKSTKFMPVGVSGAVSGFVKTHPAHRRVVVGAIRACRVTGEKSRDEALLKAVSCCPVENCPFKYARLSSHTVKGALLKGDPVSTRGLLVLPWS